MVPYLLADKRGNNLDEHIECGFYTIYMYKSSDINSVSLKTPNNVFSSNYVSL